MYGPKFVQLSASTHSQEPSESRAQAHLSRELAEWGSLIAPHFKGLLGQLGLAVVGSSSRTGQQACRCRQRGQWPQPELDGDLHIHAHRPQQSKPIEHVAHQHHVGVAHRASEGLPARTLA